MSNDELIPVPAPTFEETIDYHFKNKSVLEQALRHSSYVNEQSDADLKDNERLEFLGDAVLNLVVGHLLMKRYPDINEGDLSRMRSNLVNETHLAQLARSIKMGPEIKLGKGEDQTNGREKNSILSDVFEALIAAVYLDGGFDVVFNFVERTFSEYITQSYRAAMDHDAKSRLQEFSQVHLKAMPRYKVVHESGPDHDKTFRVLLTINDIETFGVGKSKKSAEQNAAGNALDRLQKEIDSSASETSETPLP
jgi:ribonuclease III